VQPNRWYFISTPYWVRPQAHLLYSFTYWWFKSLIFVNFALYLPGKKKNASSLNIFFRKFYHLASTRILEFIERLDLNEQITKKIWNIFEYSIVYHIDLIRDRHLDQIIMSAIYVTSKVLKSDDYRESRGTWIVPDRPYLVCLAVCVILFYLRYLAYVFVEDFKYKYPVPGYNEGLQAQIGCQQSGCLS
jgi:hypothetical protein